MVFVVVIFQCDGSNGQSRTTNGRGVYINRTWNKVKRQRQNIFTWKSNVKKSWAKRGSSLYFLRF